jgi:hypothetical protein
MQSAYIYGKLFSRRRKAKSALAYTIIYTYLRLVVAAVYCARTHQTQVVKFQLPLFLLSVNELDAIGNASPSEIHAKYNYI